MTDRPTALAVSPHLDDAVFSAGGTLAMLARAGWRVVVATVFTESVPEPRGFALACQLDKGLGPEIDYMALRRDEDVMACEHICAEPRWLAFREAPHRGYNSAAELFGPIRSADAIVEPIADVIRQLDRELSPAFWLAPQAIGGHVDHRAVVQAIRAATLQTAIAWWQDFPYVERSAAPAQPFAALFGPARKKGVLLDPSAAQAKASAALAYRSQIGFQFGGPAALAAKLEATGRTETFAVLSDMPLPIPW